MTEAAPLRGNQADDHAGVRYASFPLVLSPLMQRKQTLKIKKTPQSLTRILSSANFKGNASFKLK